MMAVWRKAAIVVVILCCAQAHGLLAAEPAARAEAAAAVPAWLEAKIGGLTEAQRNFLLSDEAVGFAGTREKLLPAAAAASRPTRSPRTSTA